MKFAYLYIILIAVLASCKNENKREPALPAIIESEDSVNATSVNGVSEKTITFLNETDFSRYVRSKSSAFFDWNKFTLKGFWKEDFELKTPFTPGKKFYDYYGKFLKYSPDSSMFIDLDSYNIRIHKDRKNRLIGEGQDPDTEVSLVDLNKKQRKRLVFMGPGNSVEDAAWIDNEKFILIGIQQNNNDTANVILWKFDIASQTGYLYQFKDSNMVKQLKDFSKNERLKDVVIH